MGIINVKESEDYKGDGMRLRKVKKQGKTMIQIWLNGEFQEEFEYKPVTYTKNGNWLDVIPVEDKE